MSNETSTTSTTAPTSSTVSSTTSPTTIETPSATNTAAYEMLLKQYTSSQKPLTAAQIRANGEVKTRLGILWFVGVISVLLIAIGGISILKDPQNAKDVWVIIGPLISSAITGTVAYFTGERNSSQK